MYFLRICWISALLCWSGSVLAAEIVIKFSHIASSDSPKGLAAIRFKELAEKGTGGRVRVDIYPDGRLVGDADEIEALQLNAVQMLAPACSKIAAAGFHAFEVFDLPYLFRDLGDVHRITRGPIGRQLLNSLDTAGITGLVFWDAGFKNFSANVPLRLPADLRGLRMRIQPSKVLSLQMTALGATPFMLPFQEAYPFLRNGLIDGTETPPALFDALGLSTLQKNMTLTRHGFLGFVVISNSQFWNNLPADIRTALNTALNEATTYANEIAERKNIDSLLAMRRAGRTAIIEPNAAELAAWRNALSSVESEATSRIGQQLIQNVHKELSEASQ